MTLELKNFYKKSKKSFCNLDKNQDGFISMSEIDAYMKKMNVKWAETETEKYMKEVDLDDDGKQKALSHIKSRPVGPVKPKKNVQILTTNEPDGTIPYRIEIQSYSQIVLLNFSNKLCPAFPTWIFR